MPDDADVRSLYEVLMSAALGSDSEIRNVRSRLNSSRQVTEQNIDVRTLKASPNIPLIMELIDRQIGGEKDWC